MICVTGVYPEEKTNMFFIGQVSVLVENFNIGYSDTINVINGNLCMMVLLIEIYLILVQHSSIGAWLLDTLKRPSTVCFM